MAFLNWFESNPQEEDSDGQQLSLLDSSQPLVERQRVDGALVRKRYTQTIKEQGGTLRTYAEATEELTQTVMGCGTKELYQRTGAKQNKRETLPVVAQEALLGAEIVANHDLKQQEVSGDAEARNDQIVSVARESGNKWRKMLPW
jgi:hypothetical protein